MNKNNKNITKGIKLPLVHLIDHSINQNINNFLLVKRLYSYKIKFKQL